MAATKPQIRSLFATPVAIHFLPVAQELNAELRPLILEKAQAGATGEGWTSGPAFESWGAEPAQTVFRVARDLADNMTSTRTGARVALDWKIAAVATVRQKGEYRAFASQPGAYWSGVYYVDDGYAKSDDPTLGGECELADPRGALPNMVAPQLGFRIPGGQTAGSPEVIRPQSGMIILHPSWLARGERRYDGEHQRVMIEFDLIPPEA
ncbi:MAG TPA: putative 2OG-Fe(II) oxygenase [Rhizomicrobium sp.]|nr:putative 2OG-Fe(II) oxygenase [Rhizomicrobium sp.]